MNSARITFRIDAEMERALRKRARRENVGIVIRDILAEALGLSPQVRGRGRPPAGNGDGHGEAPAPRPLAARPPSQRRRPPARSGP